MNLVEKVSAFKLQTRPHRAGRQHRRGHPEAPVRRHHAPGPGRERLAEAAEQEILSLTKTGTLSRQDQEARVRTRKLTQALK